MAAPNKRRLSRRAFLSVGATAVCGTGAALVFGCDGGGPSATQAPSSTGAGGARPRSGGQMTIGRLLPLPVLSLDPHLDDAAQDITELMYSRLYRWDETNQSAIFNDLATAVEIPDPDHTQFIFTLRPGVKIHSIPGNPASGGEITSEDCKQSFIRRGTSITASDKRLALAIAGTNHPDPTAIGVALQTPDPHTFSFKLSHPLAGAMRQMAQLQWAIVPATVIDLYAQDTESAGLTDGAYGSGPFMLAHSVVSDRIVLLRHPYYFLNPRPWLEQIVFKVEPDREGLLSGLRSGRYDAVSPAISNDEYVKLKDDDRLIATRSPAGFYPCLQLRMQAPFTDLRVRQAIDLALHRDNFVDSLWHGEAEYNGPVPWAIGFWALPRDEVRNSYPHDPARARSLLEEAGYADGFQAGMKFPKWTSNVMFDVSKAASLIASNLNEIGVTVRLEGVELGSFIANTILPGDFEMAFFPNISDGDPDRALAFYTTQGTTGVGNWTGYTSPEVDALVEAQAREFDEQRRRETIYEAQRLMIKEHGPQITLPSGYEYDVHASRVHYPYEIGVAPPSGTGPWGADIWTDAV